MTVTDHPPAPAPPARRPRVLYIGTGQPWAGGAGYLVRQRVSLGALADVAGELHLAMFGLPADATPPPFPVASVTPLPGPARRKPGRLGTLLGDLTSPLPRTVRSHDPAATRAAVAALCPESFDAVFCFRIDSAHFAGVLGHRRLILDVDDPEHTRFARHAALAGPVDARTRRDLAKLQRFEVDAEARAALAFVCQTGDANGWRRPPEVVPNAVDLPPSPARRPAGPLVLFVGNCLGSLRNANVDGVTHFLTDVWPAVRRAVPDAQFHIVGPTGDTLTHAAADQPGVSVRGFVADLADAYAAAVAVAPIRFGTGTRIKILEAFAHACPVLSTPIGAEGIAAVPGRDIEMAVAPDEFARRLTALLLDRPAAERIGAAGRALAERSYDAAAVRRHLADRLARFLAESPSGAGDRPGPPTSSVPAADPA